MAGFYALAGPLLRLLDAETAHRLAIGALKRGVVPRPAPFEDPSRRIPLWGMDFANPVGLAAGFDKDAEAVDALLGQGFGYLEVGGVTPRPQPGNPRPRLFRLPADRAVLNPIGFNRQGLDAVARRRRSRPSPCSNDSLAWRGRRVCKWKRADFRSTCWWRSTTMVPSPSCSIPRTVTGHAPEH